MKSPFLPLVALLAFSLFAKGQTPSLSPNFFGIGADNHTSQHWDEWLPQMSSLGLTEMRCLRCTWSDVEPEEGKWTWERLDKQLTDAAVVHADFTGIFMYVPKWDTKDKPGGFPMNNLPAWSEYVTQTVKHINGRAHYFEVWNEPPNGTHGAPASDYAKLVVATYDAAKATDPNCKIGLAAQSVNLNYLDQTLAAGAKGHYDYITLHPYEVLGGVQKGFEPVFMSIVPNVRKMLAARDPEKVNTPIWFSEIGAEINDKNSPEMVGQLLVKAYTMALAQGVKCVQWFECKDGDSGKMGLMDKDGAQRPAYKALARLAEMLGPHPIAEGWVMFDNEDYGFVFQGAKGTVLVAWAPVGLPLPAHVTFGESVQVLNPVDGATENQTGCTLTNAPVIITGALKNIVTQARANKTKPFPWHGDYTNEKSVSVTMGDKVIEKGLHMQSATGVAADVAAYGGSGRAGNVPGGNVFMVDPNFLSYETTPIEITVVTRRNPANDNAGFGLKYESTSGWKGAGWYTVPDNKEWHTKTWRIDDPQFVSKWGFNFALDSDGNQFNKYYIQSVTVTKLAK